MVIGIGEQGVAVMRTRDSGVWEATQRVALAAGLAGWISMRMRIQTLSHARSLGLVVVVGPCTRGSSTALGSCLDVDYTKVGSIHFHIVVLVHHLHIGIVVVHNHSLSFTPPSGPIGRELDWPDLRIDIAARRKIAMARQSI
eukprot:TRINITY_DN220_c0_g1::TRINITY_DN220_c0_g1_i1::g.1590::m.1590 TRINITY_DN220_c0_g1::TRINITY_DN220_c0_g1_i1::g.1590  ORF type:complete len:142 (+),score=-15.67,TPR_5/PF12688.2/0.14 TRINITY_DN220_c0_g1_i1:498-923(+)